MNRKTFILVLTFLVSTSFDAGPPDIARIVGLYHHADSLFQLPQSNPATDRLALAGFQKIIDQLQNSANFSGRDTLLFQSWLKKGILLDARSDFGGARTAYGEALRSHGLSDSLAFVAQIYAGACYYNLNNFDSANYYLLKAESQVHRFHDQDDEVRLYNTLGVLYYDNGNYMQGKDYFDQALEIVRGRKPFDTVSAVNLQTNIATSFYHLGRYEQSLAIYNKILAYHIDADRIYMNMGMAYASLAKYPEAMKWFRKVNAKAIPGVWNEMGHAQFQMGKPDSSAWYLDRLHTLANLPENDLDWETNAFYRADLLAGHRQFFPALQSLQKAIILCSRHFSDEDIYSNPSNFTGTFATFRLFDALLKKAVIFVGLFREQPREQYLMAAFDTYRATLAILRYIEKNYDTDDAKIFLKQRNSDAYQGALAVCLELGRLKPTGHYAEQAFMISENNKASIITANRVENGLNRATTEGGALQQKEKNIKYNIARLNISSETKTGSKEMEAIAREKAGYEIELARVQNELEHDGNYYQRKYNDSAPAIAELQEHLDDRQALISFYASKDALHAFVLTHSTFGYVRIDSVEALQRDVRDWLDALKTIESGQRFKGGEIGSRIYRRLIKPLQDRLIHNNEWIIIPDGFLYFLPVESLPTDKSGATLLETTTISYLFSSRFMLSPAALERGKNPPSIKALAFAPFADVRASAPYGATLPSADGGGFILGQLPASREEIADLPGTRYADSQATKERFLAEFSKYPIIHLATHAVSSIDNAAKSFVAFYPAKKSPIDNCLFLEELYGLDMNGVKMVVISACETGQGELVSKEGVISLARAFAYAGCGATISSLWKADDQSTSFILRKFYKYLERGDSKANALRSAKLDYLRSGAINKSPSFWSHLMLIGNSDPVVSGKVPFFWVGAFVCLAIIFFGFFLWIRMRGGLRKK